MEKRLHRQFVLAAIGLSLGLLFMGALRYATSHPSFLTQFSGYATPGYVLITIAFTVWLVRIGLPLNRFGFGTRLDLRQILIAIAAIAVLRVFDFALSPLIEEFLGSGRKLERFAEVQGSLPSLVALLLMNWTLAAFGEEFTYRIVLMRAISFVFRDTRLAQITAVLLQAIMFGLIHAYQGSAGIVGATFSGLVFGVVTIAARWSIWPAALAHGMNNSISIVAIYFGES